MTCKVNVDNFTRDEWERNARSFADYNIYQTWPYQENRAEMAGQKVSRVMIKDENGQVVTMCHVRIKHIKPLGLRIGYVQWGPLIRGIDEMIKCSSEALKALRTTFVGTRLNVLRIVPNIHDNELGKHVLEMLISSGFQRVNSEPPYRTLLVKTDDSEECIRKRLRKSFRRDLKKAEKAGIEVHETYDVESCRILEHLYTKTSKRKGFKGLDIRQFIETQQMLLVPEKMNIIIAYYRGKPASVLLSSNLGNTAIVLLAASNEQGLVCGSSYIVWYRGALSALNAGMKYYDLGGIDPEKNASVYRFKLRTGGQDVCHIGIFEICDSLRTGIIWRTAKRVYNLIKK